MAERLLLFLFPIAYCPLPSSRNDRLGAWLLVSGVLRCETARPAPVAPGRKSSARHFIRAERSLRGLPALGYVVESPHDPRSGSHGQPRWSQGWYLGQTDAERSLAWHRCRVVGSNRQQRLRGTLSSVGRASSPSSSRDAGRGNLDSPSQRRRAARQIGCLCFGGSSLPHCPLPIAHCLLPPPIPPGDSGGCVGRGVLVWWCSWFDLA